MNVLHLIESSEAGGAETVLLAMAKGLRDKGHTSVVSLLQPGWLHEELKQSAFPTVIVEQDAAYDLGCLRTLSRLIRQFSIDVIHAHEFMMSTYGTAAGFYEGVPVISTVHGKNYYPFKLRRRLAYRIVSRLSTLVAVSEDMRDFLADRIGISRNRITTVHNGIECEPFEREPRESARAALNRELSIPPASPVIGTVGMLTPEKDHSTLLRAAQSVVLERPQAVFLIVGSGPLESSLRAEARRMGVEKNVRFVGFRRDVAALLHIMDVYVCSSISEGLSLSILEAMAAARPVVATEVGGNPELVVNDNTGFLVPAGDAAGLASRITLLLEHEHLARAIGLNARRLVFHRFTRRHMVDAYEELYHRAAARPQRERREAMSRLARSGSPNG